MTDKPTTVRFAPDINAAIRQFAADMGISFNAALSVLAAYDVERAAPRRLNEGELAYLKRYAE